MQPPIADATDRFPIRNLNSRPKYATGDKAQTFGSWNYTFSNNIVVRREKGASGKPPHATCRIVGRCGGSRPYTLSIVGRIHAPRGMFRPITRRRRISAFSPEADRSTGGVSAAICIPIARLLRGVGEIGRIPRGSRGRVDSKCLSRRDAALLRCGETGRDKAKGRAT